MTDVTMDWDRQDRIGVPEAVFCEGKSAAQIGAVIAAAGRRPLLLTRLDGDTFAALPEVARTALDYDPLSRTAFLGPVPIPAACGTAIVTAGTSDSSVAREAMRTLAFSGYDCTMIADVGVAGLWRLTERLDELRRMHVVIAVAGMEGALFSVLGGLISAPIIAVPSSVGYGVAQGGTVALHAALSSCAPGIAAVNIDGGFSAATTAIKILKQIDHANRSNDG